MECCARERKILAYSILWPISIFLSQIYALVGVLLQAGYQNYRYVVWTRAIFLRTFVVGSTIVLCLHLLQPLFPIANIANCIGNGQKRRRGCHFLWNPHFHHRLRSTNISTANIKLATKMTITSSLQLSLFYCWKLWQRKISQSWHPLTNNNTEINIITKDENAVSTGALFKYLFGKVFGFGLCCLINDLSHLYLFYF